MKNIRQFPAVLLLVACAAMRPASASDACQDDQARFCADKNDPAETLKCLGEKKGELSSPCKQEIDRFLQARQGAAARGGGALAAFGGLNALGPPLPLLSYEGRYLPGEDGPSLTENKLNLSGPVYRGEADTVALSLAGSRLRIGDALSLDNGAAVPTTLSRLEVGAQYSHQLPAMKTWGLRASLGYAGDKPFDGKDLTYSAAATYGFPGSGGYWVLMLLASNNTSVLRNIPIPGVMYVYRTPTFTGMFGFPVISMQWTPTDPWTYSVSITGVQNAQAEIAYGHIDRLQVFGGYAFAQQNYIPSVRPEERDRLTLQEQKAGVGIRLLLLRDMLGELQAGRSFDRSIYVGDGFRDKRGGSTALDADWFVTLGLKYAL